MWASWGRYSVYRTKLNRFTTDELLRAFNMQKAGANPRREEWFVSPWPRASRTVPLAVLSCVPSCSECTPLSPVCTAHRDWSPASYFNVIMRQPPCPLLRDRRLWLSALLL